MKSIKAKKSFGQNFLQDKNILEIISSYFDILGQNILEIGPGYGALTEYLVPKNPRSLHLVELDSDMVDILQSRIEKKELEVGGIDFQIFHQDVLKFQPSLRDYLVIANIPYYITSPILTHFLYNIKTSPQKMLIMMQREVGERILEGKLEHSKGQAKKTRSSVLSLIIAKKCSVEKVCDVPKTAFRPVPKVESIVIAFERHDLFQELSDEIFLAFIKICFQEPRKKLLSNLVKGGYKKEQILEVFAQIGISEMVRAEELNPVEIINLSKNLR